MKEVLISPTREQVVALAKRSSGFSTGELLGYSRSRVGCVADKCVHLGLIFRSKISHKTVRYFGTKAEASEHENKHRRPTDRAANVTISPRSRAPWNDSAQPHFPKNKDGTPAYKITVAPTPERALRTNTHWHL